MEFMVGAPHSLQWTLEIQHDLKDLVPGNYGILVESSYTKAMQGFQYQQAE